MNKALILGIAAVVLIVGAGVYVSQQKAHEVALMTEQKAQEAAQLEKIHADEAMKQDAMKTDKSNDATMAPNTDAAMKAADAMHDKAMTAATGTMMHEGSYETYSAEKIALKAASGKVVLFFHANWCPTCRAVDADIKAHLSAIPAGLTILDVDYDTSTDLKAKYGVTYQHTFVEVDAKGTLIKKWSGSPTLAALVAEVK